MRFKDELVRARSLLLLEHPFWGTCCMRMPLVEDERIGTAATDGESIRYAPAWLAGLGLSGMLFVFAHECAHAAHGHSWRRGDRDPSRWNAACDYAINGILVQMGLEMPKCGLLDQQYNGLSAEDIYERLPAGFGGADPGGCGGVVDGDAENAAQLAAEWKVALAQAAAAAGMGTLPAELRTELTNLLYPKLPWYALLRDFVERTARNDYNWSRPNVRHLQRGIVLPTLISEELPQVVVVRDTSGSISDAELETFSAEASGVLSAYETTIHLLDVDASLQSSKILSRIDLPFGPGKALGRGGTDFCPAFDYAEKLDPQPACLIYLTDLRGRFPLRAPGYPVLWVTVCANSNPPFGDAIELK